MHVALVFLPNRSKQPKCHDKPHYQSKGCEMLASMLMSYLGCTLHPYV